MRSGRRLWGGLLHTLLFLKNRLGSSVPLPPSPLSTTRNPTQEQQGVRVDLTAWMGSWMCTLAARKTFFIYKGEVVATESSRATDEKA